MSGKGVNSQIHIPDFVDEHDNHEVRIKALESGAHPVRFDLGNGITTPWFPVDKAPGWTGSGYWRLARSIVQLRGTLTGPAGWGDNTLIFDMTPEVIPAWPLDIVVMHANKKPTYLHFETNGGVNAFRADGGSDGIQLDSVRFPRG